MTQFLAYAKANGDRITFADGGAGGATNLCALLFMSAVGVKFTSVSYKGSAPAMKDLLGGQVDMLCDGATTSGPYIASGKIRAIGITGRERLHTMPNVPTLDEQGLKGFEVQSWMALYAPKNTRRPVVDRLSAALQGALADRELLAQLDRLGMLPAEREQATPAGLRAHLKAETEKWGSILKKAGIPQID